MSKKIKMAFLGSLVLNLLLLGVLLGQAPRAVVSTSPTRQERFEEKLKKLPEPAQSKFREKFTQIRAANKPLRREIDEARSETLQLLGIDPFDEAAYDRQVMKIRALRVEMFERMGQDFKKTVKQLSPDERRMLADVLRRPGPSE